MKSSSRKTLAGASAAMVVVMTVPHAARGQTLSSRPAAVALTVIVPPRTWSGDAFAAGTDARIVRRAGNVVDFETTVGVGDRPMSRVEVRLDRVPAADSTRVWVRNSSGTFERLGAGTAVIAIDVPMDRAVPSAAVMFRIEPDRPRAPSSVTIPVEYRLRVGTGDRTAVWSFTSRVRPGTAH